MAEDVNALPENQPEKKEASDRFRRLVSSSSDEQPLDLSAYQDDPSQSYPPADGRSQDEDSLSDKPDTLRLPDDAITPVPVPSYTPAQPANHLPLQPGQIPPAPTPQESARTRVLKPAPPLISQTPTPVLSKPAVDGSGMPLPRRVDQIDVNATRVIPIKRGLPTDSPKQTTAENNAPAAAVPARPAENLKPGTQPVRKMENGGKPPVRPPSTPRKTTGAGRGSTFNWAGCLVKSAIAGLFGIVLIFILGGSILVIQYFRIAGGLPDIDNLDSRAAQFETTRILDRNGNVLYEILDPNAGRRTYVPLEKISPYLVAATIATEDKEFYSHAGFNPLAIARAMWQNYTAGQITSGASTITQQLARNLLFTPQERTEQSVQRKTREIVLAAEITRKYTKDKILELYLNENFYGNLSYGVEAAAESYFNTNAAQLDLAQASFLAGIPQAPAYYDVQSNRDATLNRQKQVLLLMLQMSKDDNCIEVSNNPQPVCINEEDVLNSANTIANYNFKPMSVEMRFPHWVNFIRTLLENQFDPQTIYRSGFTVLTTIDPDIQTRAEEVVLNQVNELQDRNVQDGALIAIRPGTGEILAMVGSADYYKESISGQVNMSISPRQPGSSIKPLTYVAAFEKGWTPSTLLWDVESEFPPSGNPDDPREPYKPVNYDGKFHGPVTLRTALSNSYNIPAVKALNYIGIYDNPKTQEKDGLIEFARKMGITTLTRDDYGLSLTLGGGEVTLLEMTNAFATFGNNGIHHQPLAITKITDFQGNTVFEYKPDPGEQVIRPEHAYLISSILSDTKARVPMFGTDPVINLPFRAAVKTGTTNDFRDNWTIGYTPDLAVGVWVGNADFTPMQSTTGLTGAAPIWASMMQFGIDRLNGGTPSDFIRPGGIIEMEICKASGSVPSNQCPDTRMELFAADQPPLPKDQDLWQKLEVDTWTGLRASDACSDNIKEISTINISDSTGRRWIKQTDEGKEWAKEMGFKRPFVFTPDRACNADDPRPTLKFVGLSENMRINDSPVDVVIQAFGDNFKNISLLYGEGPNPEDWQVLVDPSNDALKNPELFFTWDVDKLKAGVYTLKLVMTSQTGGSAEKTIHLNLQVPTPTPTSTPTSTPTLQPTNTPTSAPTATETPIPPTDLPPLPSETPTI